MHMVDMNLDGWVISGAFEMDIDTLVLKIWASKRFSCIMHARDGRGLSGMKSAGRSTHGLV